MKPILLLGALFLGTSTFGQSFIQYYANLADSCNLDSVTAYLQDFDGLGVKEYNTVEIENTRDWIIDKYSQWGYTDIVEDDFTVFGNNTLQNIVVTKTGTLYPNTYVIIDGHYDTKNGPGTNDNGSGTAVLLEIARLIKDVPTEYSIKFIHFSGEEIGLLGSDHYVTSEVIPNNMDIKVVFNIDEVGGINGMLNNTIVCERDESQPNSNNAQSAIMTSELATCTELYSTLQTEISFAYASDYIPFMNNGYVVTGYYEKNETPHAHTSQDILAYVDIPYVHQITKGAMGATLHFAVAYEPTIDTSSVKNLNTTQFSVYPNPTSDYITIEAKAETITQGSIEIYDLTGATVLEAQLLSNNGKQVMDLSSLSPGAYLIRIESTSGVYSGKILRE